MMKTALVTGALGFCARHLTSKLRLDGEIRICGIDLAGQAPSDHRLDEYITLDMCDRNGLERIIGSLRPDWIYHLAGVTGEDLFKIYNVNFVGSLNLLECVRKYIPASSLVIIGSSAEYGFASSRDLPLTEDHPCRPAGAYGISKHAMVSAGLNYAARYGLKIVAARPFNIVGPGIPQTLVVGAILKRIKESMHRKDKLILKMGNLDTQRDFVAVDDAVDAYVKMAHGNYWGEAFNICSGRPYPIRKIVEIIASFSPLPVEIEQDPALVRSDDIEVSFGSFAKAHETFGFTPSKDIEKILLQTWQHHSRGEVSNSLSEGAS
ncbi:MAG: NAD-dependent epimerase/dehydratase family protein [Deltaproteobacteria bacterium]|nr:NAD-dependent epimerase/dehydratase family protein [Deltaproteobacteria bacterium]